MNAHMKWYEDLTNGDSGRAAATKAGLSIATLNRQIQREEFPAETVIALARAYESSPLAALVTTGYLAHNEVAGQTASGTSQLLTDRELVREVARRINVDPAAWFGTFGEVAEDASDDDWRNAPLLAARTSRERPSTPRK